MLYPANLFALFSSKNINIIELCDAIFTIFKQNIKDGNIDVPLGLEISDIHNFFGIKPVSARQLSALGETLKFHEYTIP